MNLKIKKILAITALLSTSNFGINAMNIPKDNILEKEIKSPWVSVPIFPLKNGVNGWETAKNTPETSMNLRRFKQDDIVRKVNQACFLIYLLMLVENKPFLKLDWPKNHSVKKSKITRNLVFFEKISTLFDKKPFFELDYTDCKNTSQKITVFNNGLINYIGRNINVIILTKISKKKQAAFNFNKIKLCKIKINNKIIGVNYEIIQKIGTVIYNIIFLKNFNRKLLKSSAYINLINIENELKKNSLNLEI